MMKLLKRLFDLWRDGDNVDFRMERFLATSVDVADLERRQRRWDAMTEAERNSWRG